MLEMWKIRSKTVTFDATAIYEGYPTFFTIELHHGGKFTKFPSITYNDGKIDHVDLVDMDEFSVHELDSMMLQLGYESESIIYYQFQLPTHEDFAFGLRALGNDADVINLAQYIEEHKVIKVYTEHGTTNLFTYFMSPSTKPRVIIEEIPSEEEVHVVKPSDGVLLLNYIPEQVPRRAISDILLNNLCEVFNSKLIQARDKPIISCLEFIRQYLMKRICNVLKVIGKATGPLTPTATKLLERNREASVQYRARWSGTSKFEVYGPWHDQHVVDMKEMSCTCRRWELNGIPCKHAIATIHEMGDSGEVVGELYTYVNKVYYLETWKEAYSHHVDPIKGRAMWPKSQCPFKLTPPPHHTQPGRPKKERKRSVHERSQSQSQGETQRLSRKHVSKRCGKCNNRGHNSRTCKGQGGNGVGSQGRNGNASQGGNGGGSQGGNGGN
ncbi:hypothetical protein LXL04_024122 [Taraxacum kok-saghyz]